MSPRDVANALKQVLATQADDPGLAAGRVIRSLAMLRRFYAARDYAAAWSGVAGAQARHSAKSRKGFGNTVGLQTAGLNEKNGATGGLEARYLTAGLLIGKHQLVGSGILGESGTIRGRQCSAGVYSTLVGAGMLPREGGIRFPNEAYLADRAQKQAI